MTGAPSCGVRSRRQPRSGRHCIGPSPHPPTHSRAHRRATAPHAPPPPRLAAHPPGTTPRKPRLGLRCTSDRRTAFRPQELTPLHSAAFGNQLAVIEHFVEKGADMEAKSTVRGHIAAPIPPLGMHLKLPNASPCTPLPRGIPRSQPARLSLAGVSCTCRHRSASE